MTKYLICGDRNWRDPWLIYYFLVRLDKDIIIMHGDAPGADSIAGAIASQLGFEVFAFPAQWDKYGRAAGPIRNRLMLDQEPDKVIAFHNDIENSKGTKDCVEETKKRGIPVEIISAV